MSAKLDKLGADLAKARAKWKEWEARAKELEARYQEQENVEICDIAHSYSLTPDQLAELLRMVKTTMPETAPAPEGLEPDSEEEAAYED